MMLRVEEFMTGEVVALRPHDTLARADALMTRAGIRHLPVIDERRHVVGIVSLKEVTRALAAREDLERPVGDIMTQPVRTIEPEAPAWEAVELLLDHRIGALPVVDPRGELIGIVTDTDFLQVAHRALHGRTGFELANL
jgi:CBS domain-containing membrane protein